MTTGLRIAKQGFNVDDSIDELYVDSSTPMLKVFRNVAGSLIINSDGSFSSTGDYAWTNSSANDYQLFILTSDILKYAPQFEAYMDKDPNAKRVRLSNIIAGVGVVGHCSGFVSGSNDGIRLSVSVTGTPPYPGEYGYFVQIYYDSASRP